MLFRALEAYYLTKRDDDVGWKPFSQRERILFAIVFILGGALWGTSCGVVLGYLLNRFVFTSFYVTFYFCIIFFVLLRFGKLLSGSVITERENDLKEIFDKDKETDKP